MRQAALGVDVVRELLVGTRSWSSGGTVDLASMAGLRDALLVEHHRRHVSAIPAYGRLAAELGLAPDGRQGGQHLLVSDDWFKGYDPAWPEHDLTSLTAWLAEVSTVRPSHPAGADDLASWRSMLRAGEVYVTVSSGTGGTRSLVPRDRATLAALRSSSGVRLPWALPPHSFDALLLTQRGMGSGIQSGATGMAAVAQRATHDDDDAAWLPFLEVSIGQSRPVVVYGSPARLARLLDGLAGRDLSLPPDSCVVTGGGWKGDEGGDVLALLDAAAAALGVPRKRCVDTYSTTELNTVLVSCPENRYHVPPGVQAVVVDENLQPVRGDADGRVAFLDPMAMSYPGRLVTSDRVRLRHGPCACGLTGQTLLPGIARMPGASPRGCGTTDGAYP